MIEGITYEVRRYILQIPSTVTASVKLPKFKKLRQWSHDSIVNLSQFTARTAPHIIGGNRRQHSSENPLPTTGVTTISSAIQEQQIDPKKDNHGLYALKCDRSKSLANARRGILLNLPTATGKAGGFQSVERNHEIFKSCETSEDIDNGPKLDAVSQQKERRMEPPPRKKKKVAAPHISALHQKTKQQVYRAGSLALDSLEKNDSGLYRIVGAQAAAATANITYVEPKTRAVAVVRPKVEKAVVVQAMPKVKDYEWHKHQRRPSRGKKVAQSDPSSGAAKKLSSETVDIFKSDREKLFDEFDELFEKNKTLETAQTPELAFKKLNELRASEETIAKKPLIKSVRACPAPDKNLAARVKYVNSLLEDEEEEYDIVGANAKPKIVSEHVKQQQQQHVDVNKRKIMYYNDENEMQETIMKRVQTTETSQKALSTMDVKDYDTERANLNENQTSVDYKHPTQLLSTNISSSNSLRRTIFVFNL